MGEIYFSSQVDWNDAFIHTVFKVFLGRALKSSLRVFWSFALLWLQHNMLALHIYIRQLDERLGFHLQLTQLIGRSSRLLPHLFYLLNALLSEQTN